MKKSERRRDPGLEEIWAIRERHAAEFDYDIHKLVQFYREYQKQFGDRLIPAPAHKKDGRRPAA